MVFLYSNNRGQELPNLWVYSSFEVVNNINIISSLDQHITIMCRVGDALTQIFGAYASTCHILRRKLWMELTS